MSTKKTPLRDNLLRQLKLAIEYRDNLYQLERESREKKLDMDFIGLSKTIKRAEEDVEKLRRLTDYSGRRSKVRNDGYIPGQIHFGKDEFR